MLALSALLAANASAANATNCSMPDLNDVIRQGYFRSSELLGAADPLDACSSAIQRLGACATAGCPSRLPPTVTLTRAPMPPIAFSVARTTLLLRFSQPVLDTGGGYANISRMQIAIESHAEGIPLPRRASLFSLNLQTTPMHTLGSANYELNIVWENLPFGGEKLRVVIPPLTIVGVSGGLLPEQSLEVTLLDRRAPSFQASLAADEGLSWLPVGTVLLRYSELVFGRGDDGKVAKSDLLVDVIGNASLKSITEQPWDGGSTPPQNVTAGSTVRRRLRTGSWQSAFTLVLQAGASAGVSVMIIPKPNAIFDANGSASA